jgi:hypothetical protein
MNQVQPLPAYRVQASSNQGLRGMVRGYLEEVATELSRSWGGRASGLLNDQRGASGIGGPWAIGVQTGEKRIYDYTVVFWLSGDNPTFRLGSGSPKQKIAEGSFTFDQTPRQVAQIIGDARDRAEYSPY